MVFFAIYTASQFPYTYITMEGDDFWVLTRGFWQLKLAMPPALTNWLADFLMQFYGSPFVAATIEALVLGLIGVLGHAALSPLLGRGWWRLLALLPPVLLGFYCTFSLSFLLQWVFFFALLLIYQKTLSYSIKGKTLSLPLWRGLVWSLLCVPVGFLLMKTPLLALLLVCQTALAFKSFGAKKSAYWILPLILLGVAPLTYSQQVSFIPFDQRYTDLGTDFDPITSRRHHEEEKIKKMVCLSDEGRWADLLYREHARTNAQRGDGIALRYALLAESALGTLPENIGLYPIREESQFLFQHQTDIVSQQFNRLFYLNLGVYDEAFHQAMEYGLLMRGGICFSSLRQMVDYSIEEGDWETAEKYLQILAKSSCHKEFVAQKTLSNSPLKGEKQGSTTVNTLPLREGRGGSLRADNFVGGYPLHVEMLRLARYYNEQESRSKIVNGKSSNGKCEIKKMLDYAICSYMLRGDVNSFMVALKAFDIDKDKPLPKAYQEFMERYK